MSDLASKINAWLSPTVRKRLHAAVAALGMIGIIWGLPETLIVSWTALVLGVSGLLSAILAAIMTRRADYTVLYSAAAAVIGVLVILRYLEPALAHQVTQTLAVVVLALGGVASIRTDTQTMDGAPTAEVVLTGEIVGQVVDVVVPNPSTVVDHGVTTWNPGTGEPPTKTLG